MTKLFVEQPLALPGSANNHRICDHDHTQRGGEGFSDHTSLGFSPQCFKPICLALGHPKTNFVLALNFIFQVYSNIIDHLDLNSHLSRIKIGLSVICGVFLKICQKFYKIFFMTYLSTTLFKNSFKKK